MSMREPSFLTLVALAGGRSHGYALLREVESVSNGRIRLQVGSLYAVLDRLQAEGLVAIDGEEVHQGRLRRYFALTPDGRGTLEREIERLEADARVGRQRLGLGLTSRPVQQS